MRKSQVTVIGYNGGACTEVARKAAYEVGMEVAKAGAVLVTGGLGGVMEAASSGAKDAGGMVVGIIPGADAKEANDYCDVVISTGMGFARNFMVVYSADSVVVVGGGAGTLIEISAAYQNKKPIFAVEGTGGMADKVSGSYMDERKSVMVIGAKSPAEAARMAIRAARR